MATHARELTDNERAALLWLLDGNGQKTIRNKDLDEGEFRGQHNLLRLMRHDLEARGFVKISHPDYFGNRWVNITDAGRMALEAASKAIDSEDEADDERRRAAAKRGSDG